MQKITSVEILLSGNRSVRFTAVGNHVQAVATGYVTAREIAEARPAALQRLADENGVEIPDGAEVYQPRMFEPGRPAGVRYNTRLLSINQTKGGGGHN